MSKILERIEAELNGVREERRRAEQDSNSQLPILEGWEGALVWVKRIMKEEAQARAYAPEIDDLLLMEVEARGNENA